MEELRERIKKQIISEIDFNEIKDDQDMAILIDRYITENLSAFTLSLSDKLKLRKELFNSLRKLDVLTELLEDETITEIMVNGYQNIFIERNGRIEKSDKFFESKERLAAIIGQIVADCNRRINEASPIVDARLKDGSRVNIVISPISLEGHTLTIRKFPKEVMTIEKLIELGSFGAPIGKVLKMLVVSKYNIFVSGGTGSGKTSFLNALSSFIPSDERIITIEDAAELRLDSIDNLVRLEARAANIEGENEISIRDLIKSSLRMRPDRIIVGEVRDEAVIDMITAMNTGHDGSLSTGHANSCEDMMLRLETMYLMGMEIPVAAIRRQLASAIDIVIHLGRLRDRSRKVMKICEVVGVKNGDIELNTLFEFVEQGEDEGHIVGVLKKVNDLISVEKLVNRGMFELYQEACFEV